MDDVVKLGILFDRWKEGKLYILLDLERTIQSGIAHYWTANRHGYVTDIKEAGFFDEPVAQNIVDEDFDKRTVMIPTSVAEKILKK